MNTVYGVTGFKGKLGSLLVKNPEFVPLNCDITNIHEIEEEIRKKSPDIIINCASISDVDRCEENPQRAIEVNVRGLHNLFSVFGSNILNISSDYVFSGRGLLNWFLPHERSPQNPVNVYGFSKFGAEALSNVFGGKTLRLSRTISTYDNDMVALRNHQSLPFIIVPDFIHRNYLTRYQAVSAIRWFTKNYQTMPAILNFGMEKPVSMFTFFSLFGSKVGIPETMFIKRTREISGHAPRPHRGGFKVDLAYKYGFPRYTLNSVLDDLVHEWYEKRT